MTHFRFAFIINFNSISEDFFIKDIIIIILIIILLFINFIIFIFVFVYFAFIIIKAIKQASILWEFISLNFILV